MNSACGEIVNEDGSSRPARYCSLCHVDPYWSAQPRNLRMLSRSLNHNNLVYLNEHLQPLGRCVFHGPISQCLAIPQPKRDPEEDAPAKRPEAAAAPSPEKEGERRARASSSADSAASSVDGAVSPSPKSGARTSLTKFQRESASGFTLKQQVRLGRAGRAAERGYGCIGTPQEAGIIGHSMILVIRACQRAPSLLAVCWGKCSPNAKEDSRG